MAASLREASISRHGEVHRHWYDHWRQPAGRDQGSGRANGQYVGPVDNPAINKRVETFIVIKALRRTEENKAFVRRFSAAFQSDLRPHGSH